MAIITHEEADLYSPAGNSEWFSMKNDGDIARVQFMHDSHEDIPVIAAHKVKVGDKERYVDCLRQHYNSPLEECPFCDADIKATPVRFVIMYQHDDQKVKIWERGKTFIKKLQSLANRYYPLSEHVFEIERQGKPRDPKTTYDVYHMDNVEPYDLSEIEVPNILGSIVLQKSFEEMEYYLENGDFPSEEDSGPVRRGAPARRGGNDAPSRRVPASGSAPQASRASARTEAPAPRGNIPARSTPTEEPGVRPRATRASAPNSHAPASTSRVARRGGPVDNKDTEVF